MFSCRHNNELQIDFGEIDQNNIEIYLSAGIPSRINDNPYLIYRDGYYYDIPNVYGENDWIIYYKKRQIIHFRHFKTNSQNNHIYNFKFRKADDSILCIVNIIGNNCMKSSFVSDGVNK